MTLQKPEIPIVEEMIRIIFHNFSTKKSQLKLTKKTIQKILFKASKSLPENNSVKKFIPFYWFLEGPYSEVIDETIGRMKAKHVLLNADETYELYKYDPDLQGRRLIDHQEFAFEEVRKSISSVVDSTFRFSNLQLVKEVYAESPILFYPSYKVGFLPHFESYCDHHIRDDASQNIFTESVLLSELKQSILTIPPNPTLADFKTLFLKFCQTVEKAFEFKTKKDSRYVTVLKSLKGLSEEMWNTFAYGARILEHDAYYQYKVPHWEKMFSDKTKILGASVITMMQVADTELDIQLNSGNLDDKSPEDQEFRTYLARSIGINDLPEYDPRSFDRLTGMISHVFKNKEFDAVEIIRGMRSD